MFDGRAHSENHGTVSDTTDWQGIFHLLLDEILD